MIPGGRDKRIIWCCKLTYFFEIPSVIPTIQIQQALLELPGRQDGKRKYFLFLKYNKSDKT